jgi:amidase
MHHRLGRERVVYRFAADDEPALEAGPGDRVTFETLDSWSGRLKRPEDIGRVPMDPAFANPATGPVHVRGAEPGDALVVSIEEVRLLPPGLAKIVPSGGILAGEVRAPVLYFVGVEGETVVFPPELGGLRLPTRPMIGVIGTAPAGEPAITLHMGDHGGNMDLTPIGPGATVYLPVAVAGALLALGDCHATMGDGELSGAGIDIDTETTVTLGLVKAARIARPMVETASAWVTYGHGTTFEEALRMATRGMVGVLSERLAVSREAALVLVSAAGDARAGQTALMPGVGVTAYLRFPRPAGRRLFDG